MDKIIRELKISLNDSLNKLDVIVDDIYFYEKSKNKFLTVVVDKIGGIDLDTIVEVSKIVSDILDEVNMPCENYILDVISKERGKEDGQ